MMKRERIDLICARCGKTRSIIKRYWLESGKPRMCQVCAVTIADKRRLGPPPHLRSDNETLDEKLASISKD
jgi:hypothetical protein